MSETIHMTPKSDFISPLDVRLLPEDGDPKWQLLSPLFYKSEKLQRVVMVPVGYITNFVSFEPLKNVGHRPSALHDFLYDCADVTQDQADEVFLEALEVTGVFELLSLAMHEAVELFGGSHRPDNPAYTLLSEEQTNEELENYIVRNTSGCGVGVCGLRNRQT